MEPVSFAFATLSCAGACIKRRLSLFEDLKQRYAAFHNAEHELREYILLITHQANKAQAQMEVLRCIWDSLDPQLQASQNFLLHVLKNKLQLAIVQVDALIGEANQKPSSKSLLVKQGETRAAKYAIRRQATLKGIVEDLESWERRFDPTWFLVTRLNSAVFENMSNEKVERKHQSNKVEKLLTGARLAQEIPGDIEVSGKSIFMQEEEIESNGIRLEHSGVRLCGLVNGSRKVIVDAQTTFVKPNSRTIDSDVRMLARKLQEVDPMTFGLLRCHGVLRHQSKDVPTFEFVFDIPEGLSSPSSLRRMLLERIDSVALDEIVRLSKLMAKSIAFVHNIRFVHKKLCPATVVLFQDGKSVLGTPFLLGFENFRLADGATVRAGDISWASNLYRHPERQGLQPEDDYIFQHDIYSLGVSLLEIGLWQSFLLFPDGSEEAELNVSVPWLKDLNIREMRKYPYHTKDIFVKMAKELLPSKLGSKYTNVVLTCLTCLDEDNRFGDESEFRDKDGILIGVRYIEKILMELEDISL